MPRRVGRSRSRFTPRSTSISATLARPPAAAAMPKRSKSPGGSRAVRAARCAVARGARSGATGVYLRRHRCAEPGDPWSAPPRRSRGDECRGAQFGAAPAGRVGIARPDPGRPRALRCRGNCRPRRSAALARPPHAARRSDPRLERHGGRASRSASWRRSPAQAARPAARRCCSDRRTYAHRHRRLNSIVWPHPATRDCSDRWARGCSDIRPGLERHLSSLRQGGTGTRSQQAWQPDELPSKYESGNLNVPGIFGLGAGVDFLAERGAETVCREGRHWPAATPRRLRRHRRGAGIRTVDGRATGAPGKHCDRGI